MGYHHSTTRIEQRRGGTTVLGLSMLLSSLGISIVTVALPGLARDFAAPVSTVQWVMLAYLLALTTAIVVAGRLGDRFGHRRVLLGGLTLFTAASTLAAVAPTFGVLVTARIGQGFGGAVLMALSMALVRETVPHHRTGSVMGFLGTMSAVGTALGPSIGGLLISVSGWRLAFAVLALLAATAIAYGAVALPMPATKVKRDRSAENGFDWPGTSCLAWSLTAFSLAASGVEGWLVASERLALLASAFAGFGFFVVVERRTHTAPLVALDVLAGKAITLSLVLNLAMAVVMMATLVVGPFYLTFALRLDEAMVGLVMAVGPVMASLMGILAGRATDRFGTRHVLTMGLCQTTLGLVCLALLPRVIGVPGYIIALLVMTPGFQLFLAANNTATMERAADDQRGMISGLLGLSRNLGFIVGASVMGALFSWRIGTTEIAAAAPDAVATAFTTTFLAGAALIVVSLFGRAFASAGPEHADEPVSRSGS